MNNLHKWQLATEAAKLLVEEYNRSGVNLYAFDFSSGSSGGSTKFKREGTSQVDRTYSLPASLAQLIGGAAENSKVGDTAAVAENDALISLLLQSITSLPGLSALQEAEGIDPTNFTGLNSLNGMIARNPYSQDYENAIGSLYDRQFDKARSMAMSGPANVRGGTARQGFELGEIGSQIAQNKFRDIRGQQDQEAGVVRDAVNIFNTIESMRRGSRVGAQGQHVAGEHTRATEALGASDSLSKIRANHQGHLTLAAETLGKTTSTTTDALSGRGSQSAQNTSMGMGVLPGCCFIFLEALNGELPEYVRKGRDEFATENRINGYRWMSKWLVPLMQKSKLATNIVNRIMIRPFLTLGAFLYDRKKRFTGWVAYPYCYGWFMLWSLLGKVKKWLTTSDYSSNS